ncbi:MAG: UPF0280 family protein [Dehalococcoidia bacterium]|nr:UPF0280 family protein [Dehalococcoidia bacterium]
MDSRRIYRDWVGSEGLVSYTITVGSTDLHVSTDRDLRREALESAVRHRHTIEAYIRGHPRFATSLEPEPAHDNAPVLVHNMAEAAHIAGVGPMAAVAGAIAQAVAADLLHSSREVIIENGGDVFMSIKSPRTVGLYAGRSPLTGRVGLSIQPEASPLAVCTSSGTVGHSLSFGAADACTVLARSGAVADALATALCNRIRTAEDLFHVLDPDHLPAETLGVLATIEGHVAFRGAIHLVPLKSTG